MGRRRPWFWRRAATAGAHSEAPLPAAEQAALDALAAEQELVALINGLREAQGLPALAHDEALSELARERSVGPLNARLLPPT